MLFCTYTQCTNCTKCIQMLIDSYMQLPMYVFYIYKNSTFFTFQIFALATMWSSTLFLQLCKISGSVSSYSKRYTDEFILLIYSVLIKFISIIIIIKFFIYIFFKLCSLTYCLLKLKSFMLTFQSNIL